MARPRIDPDETSRKGRRLNESWPGRIHSTWKFGPLTVLRVRLYTTPNNQGLFEESWQAKLGPFAFRYQK